MCCDVSSGYTHYDELVTEFTHQCGEQGGEFGHMLDEDPAMMERRQQCLKRLELYKSARDEVDSVAWSSSR